MRRWQLLNPKRIIPIFFAGATGFLLLIEILNADRVVESPGLRAVSSEILRWAVVLTAFALTAGILNVVAQHLGRLMRRQPHWGYSLVFLAGLLLPLGVATYGFVIGYTDPLADRNMQDLLRYVYTPLSTSLLALLAFFGLSAALRALGSGRRDALVLVLVAAVVMLLQLPLMSQFPVIGEVVTWIQRYLILAGTRGLILGGAIGALVASVRILIGVDRPYLDR